MLSLEGKLANAKHPAGWHPASTTASAKCGHNSRRPQHDPRAGSSATAEQKLYREDAFSHGDAFATFQSIPLLRH